MAAPKRSVSDFRRYCAEHTLRCFENWEEFQDKKWLFGDCPGIFVDDIRGKDSKEQSGDGESKKREDNSFFPKIWSCHGDPFDTAYELEKTGRSCLVIVWCDPAEPSPGWKQGRPGNEQDVFIRTTAPLCFDAMKNVERRYPLKIYNAIFFPSVLVWKTTRFDRFRVFDHRDRCWCSLLFLPMPHVNKFREDGALRPTDLNRRSDVLVGATKFAAQRGFNTLVVPPFGNGVQKSLSGFDEASAEGIARQLFSRAVTDVYYSSTAHYHYVCYKKHIGNVFKSLGVENQEPAEPEEAVASRAASASPKRIAV